MRDCKHKKQRKRIVTLRLDSSIEDGVAVTMLCVGTADPIMKYKWY